MRANEARDGCRGARCVGRLMRCGPDLWSISNGEAGPPVGWMLNLVEDGSRHVCAADRGVAVSVGEEYVVAYPVGSGSF